MISYEDLVYALTEWRARKGLPTTAASAPTAPPARAAAPAMAPVAPAAAPARRSAPVMMATAVAPAPAEWAPDPAGQEMTYQNDDIAIEGEYSEADAGEAMSFEGMRPSTQPGFAPVAGPPGTRR